MKRIAKKIDALRRLKDSAEDDPSITGGIKKLCRASGIYAEIKRALSLNGKILTVKENARGGLSVHTFEQGE